ncbi:hypothetical protein OPV22_009270 [Ensete ventricosum]|uniref:Uncharacterized protein n=1 Tax=Ensete ventricosum TaxID=4639 RepID=A0AAV8RIJ8_ENSVE|nr:hypothetical protein OPV22_009270 [Ensete ventricosum]
MEAGSPPAAPSNPCDEFFPQQQNQGSDDDDADSNYSSCDGEVSELERYCSASLCSSVGNYGDLLDFSDLSGAIEKSLRARPNGGVAAPWDRFERDMMMDGSSCAVEVYSSGNFDSYADAETRMMMDADEDTYSRDEHSEGEDSMLEYSPDCHNSSGRYEKGKSLCIDEIKRDNPNPLLMNSSTSFGSDDLDELMRECD